MQAVNLFQATKPELQISAVRWRGVRGGKESCKDQHELSLKVIFFFDWKKGLVFIGFIHYLATRKTASVRKRKRNFPKRSTKMKSIVMQEKNPYPWETRGSSLWVEAAFRAEPYISRSSREGI